MILENTRKDQTRTRALVQTLDYINPPLKHHTIPADVLPNASEELFLKISEGIVL